MAINFSTLVYEMCQDVFSVSCTFHPLVSQPEGSAYPGRGIFDQRELDIVAEDGSVFVDHQDILDIREAEFAVLPQQKDRVTIPVDCNGKPLGEFEITQVTHNGGGEVTLVIRRYEAPRPS